MFKKKFGGIIALLLFLPVATICSIKNGFTWLYWAVALLTILAAIISIVEAVVNAKH